jgi:hypothetical protein
VWASKFKLVTQLHVEFKQHILAMKQSMAQVAKLGSRPSLELVAVLTKTFGDLPYINAAFPTHITTEFEASALGAFMLSARQLLQKCRQDSDDDGGYCASTLPAYVKLSMLIAKTCPCSDELHRVAHCLAGAASEKDRASKLGLLTDTIHKYVAGDAASAEALTSSLQKALPGQIDGAQAAPFAVLGNHVSEAITLDELCQADRSPRIQLLIDVSDKINYDDKEQHARLAKLIKTTHAISQQTERVFSLGSDANNIAENPKCEGFLAALRQLIAKCRLEWVNGPTVHYPVLLEISEYTDATQSKANEIAVALGDVNRAKVKSQLASLGACRDDENLVHWHAGYEGLPEDLDTVLVHAAGGLAKIDVQRLDTSATELQKAMVKYESQSKELGYSMEDGLGTACADAIDTARIDVVHAKVTKGLLAKLGKIDTRKAMLDVQTYLRKYAVAPTEMQPQLRKGYTNGLKLA